MKRVLLAVFLSIFSAGGADAACWNWSKSAGANGNSDPSINFSEGMSPSSVNDSARALMARLAECRDDLSGALLTTGGAVAFAVTTNQGLNAVPTDGQQIVVRLNVNNGTASTLAADGGTAYAIQSAPGVAVSSGVLVAGVPYRVTFNLASAAWVLQDFYNSPISAGSIVTSMLANAAVTYAKMQNAAATTVLCNPTGGATSPSECTLQGLSFVSTKLVGGSLAGATGLVIVNNGGTPNTSVDITADQVVMVNSTGAPIYAAAVSLTINGTINGANGLDTGSLSAATWYNIWLLSNGTTTAGVLSLSATAPTLPSGYTYGVRAGVMRTQVGSAFFLRTRQNGRDAVYTPVTASNTTAPISMATGNVAAWTAISVSNFVPPTATKIKAVMFGNMSGVNSTMSIVPNNNYATSAGAAATSICAITNSNASPAVINQLCELNLESTNIYYAANGASSPQVSAYGWVDKVNAN